MQVSLLGRRFVGPLLGFVDRIGVDLLVRQLDETVRLAAVYSAGLLKRCSKCMDGTDNFSNSSSLKLVLRFVFPNQQVGKKIS